MAVVCRTLYTPMECVVLVSKTVNKILFQELLLLFYWLFPQWAPLSQLVLDMVSQVQRCTVIHKISSGIVGALVRNTAIFSLTLLHVSFASLHSTMVTIGYNYHM